MCYHKVILHTEMDGRDGERAKSSAPESGTAPCRWARTGAAVLPVMAGDASGKTRSSFAGDWSGCRSPGYGGWPVTCFVCTGVCVHGPEQPPTALSQSGLDFAHTSRPHYCLNQIE